MQENVPHTSLKPRWNHMARWLALIGGVINPIAFVLAYTVAGILRPGYSPIHQAISDLGVGPNGSLLDAIAVLHALLLIAFAVGFALLMRRVLTEGWRWSGVALLVLRGLAQVTTGLFTDAPATVRIHSLATIVALLSMISAFLVIGLGLRRDSQWRGWGTYSLVAALVTLVLVAIEFWAFTPGTPLANTSHLRACNKKWRGERIKQVDKIKKLLLRLKRRRWRQLTLLGFVFVVGLLDFATVDAQTTWRQDVLGHLGA